MNKLTKDQKNFINARLIDYFMTSGNDKSEHKHIKKSLFKYVSEIAQAAKIKSIGELSYQEVLDGLRANGLAIQANVPGIWKPMKDAPKCGKVVFVFCSEVGRDLAKYDAKKRKWIRTWDHSVIKKPTCWTEAPEEPTP